MPGLPIPSGKGTGGRATKVVRQSNNAVQPAQQRQVVSIDDEGVEWTIEKLQRYIINNGGKLPPHLQPGVNAGGQSGHTHNGDVHIHVHGVAPAPVASQPQSVERTFGQQAASLGVSAVAGAAALPVRMLLYLWNQQRKENERDKQRQHEIHLARLKVREQRERRDRFNNSVNYLVSHLIGFGGFICIAIIVIAIMVATPRWNYVPWGGWWEYPPPPPPHYRDYRGYEQVR